MPDLERCYTCGKRFVDHGGPTPPTVYGLWDHEAKENIWYPICSKSCDDKWQRAFGKRKYA